MTDTTDATVCRCGHPHNAHATVGECFATDIRTHRQCTCVTVPAAGRAVDPARIAQAIGDPGSILPRVHTSYGDDRDETTTAWATRAVLAVLAEAAPRPPGSPPQPEPAPGQVEVPAEAYRAAEAAAVRALRHGRRADYRDAIDAAAPLLMRNAYAAGVVDGRQTGIQYGRDVAGEDIENAARVRGRTADDFITVEFAARIARGDHATEESSDA